MWFLEFLPTEGCSVQGSPDRLLSGGQVLNSMVGGRAHPLSWASASLSHCFFLLPLKNSLKKYSAVSDLAKLSAFLSGQRRHEPRSGNGTFIWRDHFCSGFGQGDPVSVSFPVMPLSAPHVIHAVSTYLLPNPVCQAGPVLQAEDSVVNKKTRFLISWNLWEETD